MKKISRAVMLTGMNRYLRLLVLVAFAFTLAACGTMRSSVVFVPSGNRAPVSHTGTTGQLTPPPRTAIPGGSYAVVQGDTLYSIAFRKDVDFRDLAQWNGIAAPYTIWPGQSLRLSPGAVNAVPRVASSGAITATASAPVFEPVTPVAASATTPATTPETPAASMVVTTTPPPAPVAAAVANVAKPVAAVEVPVAGVPSTPPPPPQVVTPVGASHAAGGVTWRWPASGSVIK
ncbi:MAG: LysM peptidoglycan-binding domain-containing protein, partial [Rhodanobacter sp.]